MAIFSARRFATDAESSSLTVTATTSRLRARRALRRALAVFLVNFTLTVAALPGWRVSEVFFDLSRSARTICTWRRLPFALSCLMVAARVTLQRCVERSVRTSTFLRRNLCVLAALTTRPHAD